MKEFFFPKLLLVAVYILAALTWFGFATAHAGDCSLPNLNKCLQDHIGQCPKAVFPDLRTPGLTQQMLRPSDLVTIQCRMNVIVTCGELSLALDNNTCMGPDAISDDPLTDPTNPPAPAESPSPSPSPTPGKTSTKGLRGVPAFYKVDNCDKSVTPVTPDDDDDQDVDYAQR